jgi:alanine racemase
VYNLRQGRDTIVVYSRTRRPALHEHVKATGTVSIGYLDGVPRVALLEEPAAP